ncbi:LysR family transcriptional regulator [Streptomyces monticola]|uniref:LysR family transcriptional regulator n=1 Tax=Streptomyces monticola TaxID=2666263 RepID=A0ABW2JMF1_9ACTN
MGQLEIREVEAFLAVADELHFGRAGERLYVSQSRVSQLLRALERSVGARLVERTSRRVRLTPLGESLLADLRPAYDALQAAVDDARATARGIGGVLRIGFQGTISDQVMDAIRLFHDKCPDCTTEIVEIPFSDPFGPLRRHEVDIAAVLLPVEEDDLVLGQVFSKQPQTLAVAAGHPFARRDTLAAEDLAGYPLISVQGSAPEYWRLAQAPHSTPGGLAVPPGPTVRTLQEGLALVAADRGAMLMCRPSAEYYRHRGVAFIPVAGLEDSFLGLVWHRDRETARTRAFSQALAGCGEGLGAGL